MTRPPSVDVYPVGMLAVLLRAWRYATHPNPPDWARRQAWAELRYTVVFLAGRIRDRNWRAVKSHFNGFLAEPDPWPEQLPRCGSGWTRRRAKASLRRHQHRAGL